MPFGQRGGPDGPPLALYVHIPWCVRKCPYCDFNSHAPRSAIPEAAYVERLLCDLDQELRRYPASEPLVSIFIGGGTPSLFSGEAISDLLDGVRCRFPRSPDTEITLEANPGTADAHNFAAYREAGVNRLSIGIQSLTETHLRSLGRIHGPQDATHAFRLARRAGFENINLDLMYGVPNQDLSGAYSDLEQALEMEPDHLSYYQLTLEPNTAYFAAPPSLPDNDLTADMHIQGLELLAGMGFAQYEVSAYARPDRRCRHNLNYWNFGDYLGVGAGAHGKHTGPAAGRVERCTKLRHPSRYLAAENRERLVSTRRLVDPNELVLEFAMNVFRLVDGFDRELLERNTGLGFAQVAERIASAEEDGLLQSSGQRIRPTARGQLFLNDLIARFVA